MEELIVIRLNPVEIQQEVYIISSNTETVPLVQKSNINELPSVVAMSAAKYNIHHIKLAGAKDYAEEIRNKLTEKVNTCFGASNDFVIELM